jgi:hypothetical protein
VFFWNRELTQSLSERVALLKMLTVEVILLSISSLLLVVDLVVLV